MSLTLISEPPRSWVTISNANSIAVRTQAFYEFKREDAPLNEGISVTTNKNIQIDNIDLISAPYNWEVGDRIFVDYELQAGGQAQELTTIVGITDFAPDTIIEVPNTALPGSKSTTPVAGYINNLSKAYRVEFEISDNNTGDVLLPSLAYKPKQNGVLKLDLRNAFEFSIVDNRNRWLKIQYREVTDDNTGSYSSLTRIHAVKAQRQILSFEGTNLARWLYYPNKTDQSIILTLLKEPKTWKNWSTWYSFIEPEEYASDEYREKIDYYDVNRNFFSIGQNQLRTQGLDPVIRDRVFSAPGGGFEPTQFVRIYFESSIAGTPFDAGLFYKVEEDCDNGIMIQWVNSLGGLEEYLFTYNQEVEEIADTGLVIIPPINEDIADVNTAIERQVEKTTQLITCFADHLTKDEIRQLHYIKYSECVWVWLTKNPTFPTSDLPDNDDSARVKVVIEDIYATNYDTRAKLGSFSVKVRFPDNFDFFEAKLY